jgi:hypothetical protein
MGFRFNSSSGHGRRRQGEGLGARKGAEVFLGDRMGSWGVQAHGKRGKDAHFPHRSGAVAFKAGVLLSPYQRWRVATSGCRGASDERGRISRSRWVSTTANQVPGGWVVVQCRAQAWVPALGLRSESCTSSRWGQGTGSSEGVGIPMETCMAGRSQVQQKHSSLPRQAGQAWRLSLARCIGDAGFVVVRSNKTGHRQAAVRMHMHLAT